MVFKYSISYSISLTFYSKSKRTRVKIVLGHGLIQEGNAFGMRLMKELSEITFIEVDAMD